MIFLARRLVDCGARARSLLPMVDEQGFSLAMMIYMAGFNIISCSITGLRLWLWASIKWPLFSRHLSADAACTAGAVAGALISWAFV